MNRTYFYCLISLLTDASQKTLIYHEYMQVDVCYLSLTSAFIGFMVKAAKRRPTDYQSTTSFWD